MEDPKVLFQQRLGRYQAAVALEKTDRMPVATGSNYLAETFSGNTKQQTIYNPEKWLQAEAAFIRSFPEVDVLRNNRIYGPLFDAVECRTYKLPGRDLPPKSQFQFMEAEYMKADEYDLLIGDATGFMLEVFLQKDSEGKVIVGTVKGDIHDIGKNIVSTLLRGAGFEVIDLGVDVPAEQFVSKAKETGAKVIGLSALLNFTYPEMKNVVDAVSSAGIRNEVRVVIGGAPVNEQVREFTGADFYAEDAVAGVRICKSIYR